jgi:hypothetical protein
MKSNLIKLTQAWGTDTLPNTDIYINPMMIVTLSYAKNDKDEVCTMLTTMDSQTWFVKQTPEEIKKQTERVNTYF